MARICSDTNYVIDCMLETTAHTILILCFMYYLLYPNLLIDKVASGSSSLSNYNENSNTMVQSARNCMTGSSETIRQSSNWNKDQNFNAWLAGVVDGDGYIDIRNCNNRKVLKAIVIKLHLRDIRILSRIQNHFHFGRIRTSNSYPLYIISTKAEMVHFINCINGQMRLKVDSFKLACAHLDIVYKEANPILEP